MLCRLTTGIANLAVGAFLACAFPGFAQTPGDSVSADLSPEILSEEERILFTAEATFLKGVPAAQIQHVFGDFFLGQEERLEKHAVVMRGDAHIHGEVNGNVLVVFGNVFVGPRGTVEGDVVSVEGRAWLSKGAWVKGGVIEIGSEELRTETETSPAPAHVDPPARQEPETRPVRDSEPKRRLRPSSLNWPGEVGWEESTDFIQYRYNRVEGNFLGIQLPKGNDYAWNSNRLQFRGELGYGFASKTWRYRVLVQLMLTSDFRFSIGGELYDLTETEDAWLLPTIENTLAAFFLKKDFFDYYRRKGFGVFAAYQLSPQTRLEVTYRQDAHSNLPKVTNWALFRNDHDFRSNPAVDEGDVRSVAVVFHIDTRDDAQAPEHGWWINARGELFGRFIGGDYAFERYILDVRRYQPISRHESVDFRLRVGTSRGALPLQYWFDLGGISTLPGYDFKAFTGNRMLLGNVEYRTAGEALFGDLPVLEAMDMVLFSNGGWAWLASQDSPLRFDRFELSALRVDAGFALASGSGDVRLNFAHPLRGDGGWNVSLRIHRHF